MAVLKSANPEELLIDAIIKHFSKKDIFKIYREVAFLSKRIDIVLANRITHEIYAIETKVRWWMKAIEQAKLDLLGADKVYIAMPDRKRHLLSNYRNYLDMYGVGLLTIVSTAKKSCVMEIIPPSQSICKSLHYAQELKASVDNGLYFRCIQ